MIVFEGERYAGFVSRYVRIEVNIRGKAICMSVMNTGIVMCLVSTIIACLFRSRTLCNKLTAK